jgi:SAM-dependent methyltransferase
MTHETSAKTSIAPATGSVVERIHMTRQEAEAIEQDILIRRHIERYAIIRQFAYGRSVDCACGVGYGTHILAKNADVSKIYGIDSDPACIAHARKEFSGDKIEFIQGNIDAITIPDIDFMASLETIEHLPDPRCLNDFARRCNVQEILVSFPAKKTHALQQIYLLGPDYSGCAGDFWQRFCPDQQLLLYFRHPVCPSCPAQARLCSAPQVLGITALGSPTPDLPMPTAIPSEIRHLASVAEKFAALRETADFMQHHSSFKAAHDILQQETEPRRRQECLSYIERNLPREGLGRILGLSFMASAAQDAAYLRELQETLMRPPYTLQQRHFSIGNSYPHSRIRGEPPMDPAASILAAGFLPPLSSHQRFVD